MAVTTLESFPTLGFVPCPGDQPVADDVAKTVRRTAKKMTTTARKVSRTPTVRCRATSWNLRNCAVEGAVWPLITWSTARR